MKLENLIDLKETATEQLTADYACYFGKQNAKDIIELVDAEIERIKRCQDIGFLRGDE